MDVIGEIGVRLLEGLYMVKGREHACSIGVHLAIFCEENSACSFQRVLAGSTCRESSTPRGPVSFSDRERYPVAYPPVCNRVPPGTSFWFPLRIVKFGGQLKRTKNIPKNRFLRECVGAHRSICNLHCKEMVNAVDRTSN